MPELLLDPPIATALSLGLAMLAITIGIGRRPGWIVGRPIPVLAVVTLVSLGALAALVRIAPLGLRIELDPSTEPLLPRNDPAHGFYEKAVREFGGDEVFVIALDFEDGVFTRDNLLLLERVHREVARIPGVRRVQSLADTVSFRYQAAEDWVDVGRLMEEVPERPEDLAALRERVLHDPLLVRNLVSVDGRAAGIAVRFRDMTDREFIAAKIDDQIGAVVEAARRTGVRIHVAGRPHAKAAVYRGMVRDLGALVPLALWTLATVLAFATGSRRGVVLPLLNVGVALLWTFAVMALSGRPITILGTMLGPELIAIGGVFGVHLVAAYDEERHAPGTARAITERALADEATPIAISTATTMIGFGSLCLSNVPAVAEFGAFAVLGVGATSLLATSVLPALLVLLPPHREVSALPAFLARWSERCVLEGKRGLARISAASANHAGAWILGGLVAAGISAYAMPRIVIDTDYLSFFDEDSPVRQDFAAVGRMLAGAIPVYVVIDGDGPGSFREPAALRALERLEERAERLPGVSHTSSVVDTLRVMNRAIEADDPAAERIPDERAAVSEMLQLAPKDEMSRFVNADQSRANLIVRTAEVGSASIRRLVSGLHALLRETLPEGFHGEVTGNAILLARSDDGIAESQLQSVGSAAGAIFVLVTLALRSIRLGIIAMIPNLLPVAMYFGMLGLGAAPLSLPTSLIGAVALGIAVDDTVHFLVRYRRERRAGLSPEEAARVTGLRTGLPIVTAAIMLASGFLVIALSSFATLRQFGTLFAVTVLFCIVAELVLMPALLVRFRA